MKFKMLGVASSLAIVAGLSNQAVAQETGSGQTTTIVVTAEFREADLQNTPLAITAMNAEMLEARGQTDISQVAAQAPNVTLTPQPQNGGSGLIAFIRGVGQTDFNYALDPAVGIYIDDVYIPTLSSSLLELVDLDRVEILRGPQGTLAGKNSLGGAIKLFSARPRGDGSGSLRVEYGSFDALSLRGMMDFAVTENLAARFSGMARSRSGYVDIVDYGLTHPNSNVPNNNARGRGNFDYESMGGQNVVALRGALRWEPTDRLEVNVSGDFTREDSEAIPTVLIAAGRPIGTGYPTFNPNVPFAATDANGNPWLVGKNGQGVPFDCRFVPFGPYSCDTGGNLAGFDPRYISYSTFLDSKPATQQAPYKPYFALPITEFEGWGIQGNITYDLTENLQLVAIGSYRTYVSRWGQDQDASPVPVAQLDNQLNHEAWSAEVRLNFELADGLILGTVGGFYLDQNGEYTARVDLNYAGIDFIHGPDTTPSTTQALFGTVTVNPTDALSITGGLRYTKDEKLYTYFRSNPDGTVPFREAGSLLGPGFPPVCEFFLGAPTAGPTGIGNTPNCLLTGLFGISDGFEGDRFDWRIVADYRFSNELLAYASVSTGFKGGGVNPRPFFGPSAGDCNAPGYVAPAPCNQLRPFNPETITTYELGFKADLLGRSLRINGAAFLNDYQDIILTLPACPSSPCLQPRNVGEAEVKGFELEVNALPVDGLMIDGSLAYIDFQYDAASVAPAGLTGSEITPFTPEWTWSLGVQYDHQLANDAVLSFRLDGNYQSEIFTDTFNTFWSRIDSRFLANGRIAFTSPDANWQVALRVDNIFDKYYFLSVSDVTRSLGAVTGVPGLPRTFSLAVERRF